MATGTKRTKGDDIYPPREIQQDTKARRAWVAAKIAELSADPTVDSAKSVGIGSYQHVSVWLKVTVEGRERFRGVCQYCGGSHVVERPGTAGPWVVMHGYKRPGDGYLVGRCPGANRKPLNVERTETERWHAEFVAAVPRAKAKHEEAQQLEAAADVALTESGESRYSARATEPTKPSEREVARDRDILARYDAAWNAWSKEWPAYNAWRMRIQETRDHFRGYNYARMMQEHFAALLAGPAYGSPLEREIVA